MVHLLSIVHIHYLREWWAVKEMIPTKYLAQYLAQSKLSVNINCYHYLVQNDNHWQVSYPPFWVNM